MKKLTAYLLVLVLVLSLAVPASAEGSENTYGGEKLIYGISGEGRELCAYRYGTGKNVLVVGFAIHGYEDAFDQDGLALVYTAERVMEYLQTSLLPQAYDWTVYILPCMNPDGLYSGWTNNGPGRCTTTMLDENNQLVYGTGIDMNRCFPPMYSTYWSARNYTSDRPLACKEASALANFVQNVKGEGSNLLIDVHGWLSQNITTSSRISSVLRENFPYNWNSWSNGGSGYLMNYAATLGYESALLELPYGVTSLEAYKQTDYASRVVNCVAGLMQTEPLICDSVGHQYEAFHIPVTCTQDGQDGVRCTVCGYTSATVTTAPGHKADPNSIITVSEATATKDGLYLFTCLNCGWDYQAASVPRVFNDVDSSAYYADALDYCYAGGIINGVSADCFGGSLTLSRGMLVTMLYRYEGQPQTGAVSGFVDVAPGEYYYDAINWAVANGVVTGITAEYFAPNDPVTREQAMAIFHRYVSGKGLDNGARAQMNFADIGALQSYAADAASWAVANGIIQGMDGNRLAPRETANRAQSVTILKRVADYVAAMTPAQ